MSYTVDVHSHIIPPSVFGQAGPHGPEFTMTESGEYLMRRGAISNLQSSVAHRRFAAGQGGEDPKIWGLRLSDSTLRLSEMDERGVDAMVVSPSPPLYMYEIESEYGVPYACAYNDALADYCSADPQRLFFLATLPLQDPKAAVSEAHRAIHELGARGVYVGATNLAGRELDDRDLWPLYEALVAADLPLSIHPGPLMPGHELLGNKPRFREGAALGFPTQETHAQLVLIAGGVFDAFPELKVTVSHGGGFFPYQFTRIEEFLKLDIDRIAKRPVGDYISNLYYDFVLHDVRARRFLLEVAGVDHVLLGSNYAGMDSVDGLALVEELGLPDQDRARVIGGNAVKLYKLPQR